MALQSLAHWLWDVTTTARRGRRPVTLEDDTLTKLKDFAGKRLLILEDGFFLDERTKRLLEALGARVEVAGAEAAGRVLGKELSIDGAIIDINVEAELAFSLAEQFGAKDIPFLFALNDHATGEVGRFAAYRLCADIDQLKAIAIGLFWTPQVH